MSGAHRNSSMFPIGIVDKNFENNPKSWFQRGKYYNHTHHPSFPVDNDRMCCSRREDNFLCLGSSCRSRILIGQH